MADSEENLEEATVEEAKTEEQPKEEPKQEEKVQARNRLSDSLKKATYNWRETERQLAEERKRVAELEELTKLKAEPNQENYDDYNQYKADKEKWQSQIEEENEKRIEAQVTHRLEQQQAAKEQEERSLTWAKQKEYGLKNFDNWQEKEKIVVEYLKEYNAPVLRDEILDSRKGAALVDKLGADVEELENLLSLPPTKQAKRLGILEAKLEATPVKKSSSAPEPAKGTPVSASVKTNSGQSKYIRKKGESMTDYAKRVNGF